MIIPYNVDVPMYRWPIANWVIIGLTTLASAALLMDFDSLVESSTWVLQRGDGFEPLALLGNLFAHASPLHLIGNMLFLFVFGNAVNAKIGHIAFVALYLAIGVTDGLVWLAVADEEAVIGASGAIMGIVGAFLVLYPRNDVSVFYWFTIYWSGTTSFSSYWLIGAYIGLDLLGYLGPGDGVSHISHLVGAALGAGIASALLLTGLVKPTKHEETLLQLLGIQRLTEEQEVVNDRRGRLRRDGPPTAVPTRLPPELRGPAPRAPVDLSPIPFDDDPPGMPPAAPKPTRSAAPGAPVHRPPPGSKPGGPPRRPTG